VIYRNAKIEIFTQSIKTDVYFVEACTSFKNERGFMGKKTRQGDGAKIVLLD
jgi:hypothetical protein